MTPDSDFSPLVSTAWLAAHLHEPDLRIVDVRWQPSFESGHGRSLDDPEGYRAGHIPNAVFVGMVGELSDQDHPVPDMLVGPERFAEVMGRLGIGNETLVVAYDNMGCPLASARLWWALACHGHDRVRVLDGGLRQWLTEGRPMSMEIPRPPPSVFIPRVRSAWKASREDVVEAMRRPDTVIVDCLSPELYRGEGGSHLWAQRAGHIPGSVNVPVLANIDPELARVSMLERERLISSGRPLTFASIETQSRVYQQAGVTPDREVITYCGRGFAACCGFLTLKRLGYERVRLYDGSWAEWGNDLSLPVETGGS